MSRQSTVAWQGRYAYVRTIPTRNSSFVLLYKTTKTGCSGDYYNNLYNIDLRELYLEIDLRLNYNKYVLNRNLRIL